MRSIEERVEHQPARRGEHFQSEVNNTTVFANQEYKGIKGRGRMLICLPISVM